MSAPARLLAIMGSGETSPTMVKPHRQLFSRLGQDAVPAVLLDTPFGFQENADDISNRAVEYFRESVGRTVEVASFRRAKDADAVEREATLARIGQARWVFAGPGSPTYALRQWRGTEVPGLLADKLSRGGCVTFASAAALTLGIATVPVYEVYKVGADPVWEEGLGLTAEAGLNAAVIPHYDNAEGGNHDTRYCYLGERRLRILEEQLPDDAFVIGVDEHTGVILDLDAGTAEVVGLGQLTLRHHGRSATVPTGSTVPIPSLVDMAMGRTGPGGGGAAGGGAAADSGAADGGGPAGGGAADGGGPAGRGAADGGAAAGDGALVSASAATRREATPLLAEIRNHEEAFDAALAERDVDGAVRAILELDAILVEWGRDTLQSDEQDRGRAALRRMVVRLGQVAKVGARDPRELVGPFVSTLLEVRSDARANGRFEDADRVRGRLVALGLEIRDTAQGTEWELSK
jgi:cyanophycinase-like exopeptidase